MKAKGWKFYVCPNKKLIPDLIGHAEFFPAYDWMVFNNTFNRHLRMHSKFIGCKQKRKVSDKLYLANGNYSIIIRLK